LLAVAAAETHARVVVALDARMGEVYHAAYERAGSQWQCVAQPSVCAPHHAPHVEGEGWYGAGSGFRVHGAALAERYGAALIGTNPDAEPGAGQIARLGALAHTRGESVAAHLALPIYLRDKVALTSIEQASLRGTVKA
jgi:tRNA threonylcarbamoyladenosine biosynthesis protein TsaB